MARLMEPLTQFSLVRYDRSSAAYRMHRLVQEATLRYSLDADGRQTWARRFVQAMERALPRADLKARDTVIHASKALGAIPLLPVGAERRIHELRLRSILGPALIAFSGYASPLTADNYKRAQALCRRGDPAPLTFPISWGLWVIRYVRARLKESETIGRALFRQANRGGRRRRGFRVEADRALGSSLFSLGKFADASRHLLSAIDGYDARADADHPKKYAVNPRIVCSGYQVIAASYTAGERAGRAEASRLRKWIGKEAHTFSKVFGNYWLACGEQVRRDFDATRATALEVIRLSEQYHFPQWEAMGMILEGWSLAAARQAERGIERCREGLLRHRATGARVFQPYFLLLLAEAYQHASSAQAVSADAHEMAGFGLVAVEHALRRASHTGEATCTAECLRVRAELLIQNNAVGDADAERLLREAADLARDQGAAALEVRALASLCRYLRATGRPEEAQAVADRVPDSVRLRAFSADVALLSGSS